MSVLDEPLDAVNSDDRKVQPAPEPAPTTEPVKSVPPVDFKEKYAGKTRAELLACLSQVRDSRLQLQKQITAERAANGQFLRHNYTPGVEFSPSQIAKAEVDRLYPQSDQPVAFQMRGGGGKNYVEVTGIPRGEYPAFEDLQREEIWLNQTIGNQSEPTPATKDPR